MAEVEAEQAEAVLWLLPVVLIALYFPLGVLTAWMSEWTPPQTAQEKRRAVLLPTLVAWSWVGVVLLSVVGDVGELLMSVFTISFFFAAPSSLFTITYALCLPWRGSGLLAALGVWGMIAGFLPPLLFAAGSFWLSQRRQNKKEAET